MHEAFAMDQSLPSQNKTAPQGPSNEVLAQLTTSLCSAHLSFEKLSAAKDPKDSCEFDKLEDFQKHLILNASSPSTPGHAPAPTTELKDLINFSSLAKAQVLLNYQLNKSHIHVEVQLEFVTVLMSMDWIVRGSINPGKNRSYS